VCSTKKEPYWNGVNNKGLPITRFESITSKERSYYWFPIYARTYLYSCRSARNYNTVFNIQAPVLKLTVRILSDFFTRPRKNARVGGFVNNNKKNSFGNFFMLFILFYNHSVYMLQRNSGEKTGRFQEFIFSIIGANR